MYDEEIKNCPFCGRCVGVSVYPYADHKKKGVISCNCGWSLECIDTNETGAKKEVIERWNSVKVTFR